MLAKCQVESKRSREAANVLSYIGQDYSSLGRIDRRKARHSMLWSAFLFSPQFNGNEAYSHGVCFRAVHVSKEKVSEFDRIQSSEQ